MPSAPEQPHVGVGDQQDAGAAPRRGRHRRHRLRAARGTSGCPGRNGARCAATPIGPMPGPPPPCGIANVLCRFRWQTSAPMRAGLVSPTCAFMLAPSMYTWPPCSCTTAQISRMCGLVDAVRRGVGDHQARQRVGVLGGLARRSARSTPPSGALATTTTACRPAPRWPGWCRAPTPESAPRALRRRRGCGGTRESPAARRTPPARRSWAAATRRQSP